jgi:predicted dehydrogenase
VPGVGWIGADAFSTGTLLPAFRAAGFSRFVAVATAGGVSAWRAAERHGFEKALSGPAAVIGDPEVSLIVIATPHDMHDACAGRALAAGRDVWCAKPPALTCAGLDEVEKAWRDSGRKLTLGFSRRWAPAVRAARRLLAGAEGPKLVVYRIAAGRAPGGHWYLDRRQGGPLAGEVCHFVDLAQALVGAEIEDATAVLAGDASRGNEGAAVALRFADGSVGSIVYGGARSAAGEERIEVFAGSQQVIIDDFRLVLSNGRIAWEGRPDQGHSAHATAFRQAVEGGLDLPTEAMLRSMRATLQAAGKARAS